MRFAEGRRGTSPHPLHLLFYCWLVLRFDSFHREEKGTLIPPRVVDKILDPLCVCVCVCARASGVPRIFRLALWTCARARTTREDKELCARARASSAGQTFSPRPNFDWTLLTLASWTYRRDRLWSCADLFQVDFTRRSSFCIRCLCLWHFHLSLFRFAVSVRVVKKCYARTSARIGFSPRLQMRSVI